MITIKSCLNYKWTKGLFTNFFSTDTLLRDEPTPESACEGGWYGHASRVAIGRLGIGAKITQAEENGAKQTQELVAAGCLEEGLPDGGRIVNKFSCSELRNKTDL